VYQLRNNLVKYENGDLLAVSHNILNRWKNNFSKLLNAHRVTGVAVLLVTTSPVEKFDSSQVVLTGRDLGD
jgi:hypothetical protein